MKSICGADCDNCGYGKNKGCKGCVESKGCAPGGSGIIAYIIAAIIIPRNPEY